MTKVRVTTSAVILAAGAGTRLGGVAKALLKTKRDRTFLAQVIATAREVGVEQPIVVVGPPFGAEVGSAAEALGATVIVNPEPARGMASSVALGFAAVDEVAHEAAWLWPVDHPEIQADTLRQLLAALMNHDAARPVYAGRGGHPPLIARSLFAPLAQCAGGSGGARSVLAAADTIDVAVDDPGCVRDVDTAADLEAM
jgi:CTP:molybdopterin cytidylyltransferase MocA